MERRLYQILDATNDYSVIGKAKSLKAAKALIENHKGAEIDKLVKKDGYWAFEEFMVEEA
jgi:hypothetical protein